LGLHVLYIGYIRCVINLDTPLISICKYIYKNHRLRSTLASCMANQTPNVNNRFLHNKDIAWISRVVVSYTVGIVAGLR